MNWTKLRKGYFRFLDFWSSFINKNCHNSRTSHDTDIKLGPVTKLDQRNTVTSKNFADDVMSVDCDTNVFFPIYGEFGANLHFH